MKKYPMWKGNLWNDYKEDYVGATTYVMSHIYSDECIFLGISGNEEVMVSIASESPDKQFAITSCDNFGKAMNLIASIKRKRGIECYYVSETGESSLEVFNRLVSADMDAFVMHDNLHMSGLTWHGLTDKYRKASEVNRVSNLIK